MPKSKEKELIKVGFCVAYDWYMLEYAIPLIYDEADQICLSVDDEKISWSGHPYKFDEKGFSDMVQRLDKNKKISIHRGNFHLDNLSPMENEVRQRNEISTFMGEGGWHVQLDCDEYFLHFKSFVAYLRSLPLNDSRKFNVCCAWIILYKQVENGFLYVDPVRKDNIEFMQIATRYPQYDYSRRNGYFNIYTNFRILHQSWARDEQEIHDKLKNWGHSTDLNTEEYFNMWKELSIDNFKTAHHLHPLFPEQWPSLKFVPGNTLDEVARNFDQDNFPVYHTLDLYFKNSLWMSRLRAVLKR
jgi:hypothetical protein